MLMAVVKVSYTKKVGSAKASVRYLAHRPDRDGRRVTRELYGPDGELSKQQAYRMIDSAKKGTTFFRLVLSPDPAKEDTNRDLYLPDITLLTMTKLEARLKQEIAYLAVEHNDHAPHRHVHILALIKGRLTPNDFKFLREAATTGHLE